jgi:anthranilate synthase component II
MIALARAYPEAFRVTRYHSLVLKDLPEALTVFLETGEGEVMGLAHKYLPIIGLQFHPEAHLTEYGEKLIRNWVNCFAPTKPAQILY